MGQPFVSRLVIYPFKSLDGRSIHQGLVLPSGAIEHDRQFALVDSSGRLINGKRLPRIHQIQWNFDPVRREFSVSERNSAEQLNGHLDHDAKQLSDWFSNFLMIEASIAEDLQTGFPDDLESPGPTIVSTATLMTVSEWFPELTIEEVRNRFRANIEIDGVEPFWEDRLFYANPQPFPFRVGGVLFGGTNPCQRCAVPTRNTVTGEVTPNGFAQHFRAQRERTLPAWAARERFDHFYRLCTNTRLLEPGPARIQVGDPVGFSEPY